ncbi:hypothetical protein WA026_015659 [Henosepilachna vigintioctopunctata]|uniref:KIF-binding protein n=1 Tax=Henosepilachna vigintioctopunctata TaxID=420089 RepID=A0AAW1VGC9_9CUCU
MTITMDLKESINDLKEKFFKVVKLIKEDSKTDPPNEPLLSKYAARQILIPMKVSIESLLRNQTPESPEHIKLSAMLSSVYIYLGTICIDTEEFSIGEKHLEKALHYIDEFKEEPLFISVSMNAYNQLGILWFQKDAEKAKLYLDKSNEIYEKNKNNIDPPKSIDSLFETENEGESTEELWKRFEQINISTLYFLAQIYGKLKDALKSAVYCHKTLKKQLVYQQYESIDWALNAATLSQFFAEQKGFKQARHHLSAASYILDQYKKELDAVQVRDETYDSKIEEYNHRSADVSRCWAQYDSLLLSKSKDRLLAETEKDDPSYLPSSSDLADQEISNSTVSHEDLKYLFFSSLDLSSYEKQVTDNYILTLSEAKAVFLNAQNWLISSQTYYSLENLASDFIDIALSHSQLYLDLLFFDDNAENRAKYHKRRIDLLENLLDKINSQYYLSYCRKMWYEVGNAYIDLLDIKLDRYRESNTRPTPHNLSKINMLITKGLKQFNTFLKSFEDKTGQIPESYYNAYARAQFYIGVLHGKFITLDKRMKLDNTEASLQAYQKVIDFCAKYQSAKDTIAVEYGVCKEMVELLPVKIGKLKSELQ